MHKIMFEDEEVRTKPKKTQAQKTQQNKYNQKLLRFVTCSTPRGKATGIPTLLTQIMPLKLKRNEYHQKLQVLFFHRHLGSGLQDTVQP